jgi:putative hydrolase of the HAD superfamily
MIKAVIFDFDGLILDTETPWYDAYRAVFIEEGGELPIEEWAKGVGTVFGEFDPFSYLESQTGKVVDPQAFQERTKVHYTQLVQELQIRPGVEAYLQEAKALGLRIGLSSSSTLEWVSSYLKQYGLLDYFEAISTSDDVVKVKPDPALYLRTLRLLDVAGSEAVAFEDSLNGLQAAVAAGMHAVVIPNPVTEHLMFEGHRYRMTDMTEMTLEQLLHKIQS